MEEKSSIGPAVVADSQSDSEKGGDVLNNDALQLASLGHVEELERNFGLLALVGLGFVCSGSWFGVTLSLVAGVMSGGPAVLVYGALVIPAFSLLIVLSLAEMGSAYPTTAGPLEWTYRLAPRKWALFLSWMTGWANLISWLVGSAANVAVMANQMVFLANLYNPSYEAKTWQIWLIMEGCLIMNGLLNAFGTRLLPKIDTVQFYWFIGSFIIVAVTTVAAANPHQPAKFVFGTFYNATGWTNPFVVFMNGLIVTAGNFVALDASCHLAEEMSSPSRTIPKAMLMTVGIGCITDFIVSICLMFSVGQDKDAFFESAAPYLTIVLSSTGSKAAAACISTTLLVNNFISTTSVIQVGSRIIWSFARDGGFIFPTFFAKVNTALACPLPAVVMSWAIGALVAILYLASSTAFNALLSCLVIMAYVAYAIPITCLLLRGRVYDRPGTFKLGKWGWAINIVSLIFMAFLAIFFCFPVYRPVVKENMNYAAPTTVGFLAVTLILWFVTGKRNYRGSSLEGIHVHGL
ncbi:amino acid transporter [Lophium mytilinum]|uniref:Amino acid transporter n=1 Tax=Lophium mytilinum TaxID=390894 RepID=A0A6A6R8R4_9PEZI|nr:amino acid transporter [Lophium mytilinum]